MTDAVYSCITTKKIFFLKKLKKTMRKTKKKNTEKISSHSNLHPNYANGYESTPSDVFNEFDFASQLVWQVRPADAQKTKSPKYERGLKNDEK